MIEVEPRSQRRTALLLALATATLLLLAQQPVGASPLAFVALAPFVFLVELPKHARAARAAYLAGLVYFLVGCFWLRETHPANLPLMVIPEALAFPGALWLARTFRTFRTPAFLAVPLSWVAIEWLRSTWPFNGFPWLVLGNALATPIEFAQVAEWGGVLVLSFFAALASTLFAAAWKCRGVKPVAIGLSIVALHVPVLLYLHGANRIADVTQQLEPGPAVIAIQANIPQELKQDLKRERTDPRTIYDAHRTATRKVLETERADLVVWPETMFPWPLSSCGDSRAEQEAVRENVIRDLLRPRGARLLLGAIVVDGEMPYRDPTTNSAVYYSTSGERLGVYSKTMLVPGGEFIPFRDVLGFVIDPIVLSIAPFIPSLVPGSGPKVFTLPTFDGREFRFGTTICYENVYPDYHARVARDVDFVVNLSNEAWFKESFEFDQMDAASRLRAIETRRSLVRATNSGISALYSPTGERLAQVVDPRGRDRAVEGELRVEPPVCRLEPGFVRYGAWVWRGIALPWLVIGAFLGLRARYRRGAVG